MGPKQGTLIGIFTYFGHCIPTTCLERSRALLWSPFMNVGEVCIVSVLSLEELENESLF